MPRFRPDDHKIYNKFGAYVLSARNRRPTPVADLRVCPQESLKYYTRMRPPQAARGWNWHDLTNPRSVRTPYPQKVVHQPGNSLTLVLCVVCAPSHAPQNRYKCTSQTSW